MNMCVYVESTSRIHTFLCLCRVFVQSNAQLNNEHKNANKRNHEELSRQNNRFAGAERKCNSKYVHKKEHIWRSTLRIRSLALNYIIAAVESLTLCSMEPKTELCPWHAKCMCACVQERGSSHALISAVCMHFYLRSNIMFGDKRTSS